MTNRRMKNRIQEVLTQSKVKTFDKENESTNDSTSTSTTQSEYDFNIYSYISNSIEMSDYYENIETQNTNILGIPHQFLETADMRIDRNNNFGYCFAKDIFNERPIVTIMPGSANYLPDYSKADKKAFGSLMTDLNNENSQKALEDLIGEETESRYYDFRSDYSSYIRYVNVLCRVAAVYLGIENLTGPDGKTKYKYYDWGNYQAFNDYSNPVPDNGSVFSLESINNALNKLSSLGEAAFTGYRQYVNFYVDPSTSVSETATNSTQKSQLESAFDSVEGIVKEATMLLASANDYSDAVSGFVDTATSAVAGLANTVTLGMFKNLLGLAEKEVIHGANLIYPEIWTDSDYSKTYSVTLNLISPYGDKEAIYLNVFVPLLHALCLALPRQTTANTFTTPFLVRAFSNGWFSCDMGMVESITIDKGPDQSWTAEGLPTQCKITLSIKDLYSQLMIPEPKASMFFTNQGMMDFLGALCGVDLTMPNIVFKVKAIQALMIGKVTDIPNNLYREFTQSVYNKVQNLLR